MSLIRYGWAEIENFGFPGGIVALTPGTKCVEVRWIGSRVHAQTKGEMLTALVEASLTIEGYKYRGPMGAVYSVLCEAGVIVEPPPPSSESWVFRLFGEKEVGALRGGSVRWGAKVCGPEKYKGFLRPALQKHVYHNLHLNYGFDGEEQKANWFTLGEDGMVTATPRELPFAYRKAKDVLAVPNWERHPIFKNQSVRTGIHHALKKYSEAKLQDILDDLV